MVSVWEELKRRNVVRVAVAYAIVSWLSLQVTDILVDLLTLPDWIGKLVFLLLLVGLPLALLFAWAYELTPDGLKSEQEVDRSNSIARQTGRRLDRIIIIVLGVAVAFLLVDKLVLPNSTSIDRAEPTIAAITDKSVAVLPFLAMSNGPDDEYFADGLTEEILNSLSQLPELLVTARTSAFAFKGQDRPIPEIAEILGVAHVVEGSVRRSGGDLRITARLVRASDGIPLWTDAYDRSSEDSLAVQTEIAEKVAAALGVVLSEEQQTRMRSVGLRNPEAFVAYQKGIALYDQATNASFLRQFTGVREANKYFERTLELEPEFAPAHFRHADYYLRIVLAGESYDDLSDVPFEDALRQAKIDLKNASLFSRNDGQKLNAKLELALFSEQWRRLPDLIAAAIQSSDCVEPSWWSMLLQKTNSPNLVQDYLQKNLECNPLDIDAQTLLARLHIEQGNFNTAIEIGERGMQKTPHSFLRGTLFNAYIGAGQFDKTEAAIHRYEEDEESRLVWRQKIAAARGDAELARELLHELIERFGNDTYTLYLRYATIGDLNGANEAVARLDNEPFGFITILSAANFCFCGAPFDLAEAPNFERFVEEAEIPWPPARPIEWPLKDW